ncbi:MAG: 50S ribosomal protein L25 [Patescibacteria group bacterium]|nr:50S ribosomal protein L25 [Patescibacteria group bacterium]
MKRHLLAVEKRTVLGKKVKKLRRDGILPANIYGKDIKSVSVQVNLKDFDKLYKEVRETGLIDVELNGEKRPSLIHEVHIDPVTQTFLHADFYQVNLKEKIKSMIPLEIIGEAKAVQDKIGLLLQTLSEVEVEALPEELPENIEVNVEHLANIDDQILVSDLKKPASVEILTDGSQVVAKITDFPKEEVIEAPAEEVTAEGEAAEEGAEAPKEGETTEAPKEQPETEAKS